MKTTKLLIYAALLSVQACDRAPETPSDFRPAPPSPNPVEATTRFEALPASQSGITFVQSTEETYAYSFINDPYVYNGGGVAVLDIDNDGLQDLFFSSRQKSCKLYRNIGNLKFEDVTDIAGVAAEAGLKTGVVVVDINGDGFDDLYVCRTGLKPNPDRTNLLFVNNKNGTFTEQAAAFGLDDISASQCANFLDFDLDGDLDCYVVNQPVDNANINTIDFVPAPGKSVRAIPPRLIHDTDRFYRNEGNGKFTDISKEAGIWNRAWGLSVTAADLNRDGYPDLVVGNDFIMPDFVYINNGKGGFTDEGDAWIRHGSNHTMGIDIADLNNDALLDLVALDMLAEPWERRRKLMSTMLIDRYNLLKDKGYGEQVMRNTLQINNGNGSFSEIGCLAGMYATDWSWAPLIADFDNDGWKDLFISNGIKRDLNDMDFLFYTVDSLNRSGGISPARFKSFEDFVSMMPSGKVHNYMYQNNGSLCLRDVSALWGFEEGRFSNGAVYVDLDNDGDLDLVANAVDMPASVYVNRAEKINKNHWLQIRCAGPPGNPKGTGARIKAVAGDLVFYQEMTPYRGFYSSVEPVIQIGLGPRKMLDSLEIRWPGGKRQVLYEVKANQRLTLQAADAADAAPESGEKIPETWFDEGPQLAFTHLENNFEDFNEERMMHRRYSRQGPCLAAGDVNGDGRDDVFVGGAKGQAAGVFLQTPDGKFRKMPISDLEKDKAHEDCGALFFDADGDGDLDLYVVSGGNEEAPGSEYYRDRFYRNNGKGMLARDMDAIPDIRSSGRAIAAHDLDGDGDPDLVVAGRISPKKYPFAPGAVALINEGGRFKDATGTLAPGLAETGMVSSMVFADLNGDQQPELILAGEWMPIQVWEQEGGQWKNHTDAFGLSKTEGWWTALSAADLDGDGDLDLIAGNAGLNTRYRASEGAPLKLWAKDFDNNGSIDPVLAMADGERYVTVVMRDPLAMQIGAVYMKKTFPRHTLYANSSVTDLYPPEVLRSALQLETRELETCWFENDQGVLKKRSLPLEAQFAPVYAILTLDADQDGKQDVLLLGNDSGMEVETASLDASNGCLLLGGGDGKFRFVPNRKHGLWANREVRSALWLAKSRLIIAGNNNAAIQSWRMKEEIAQ